MNTDIELGANGYVSNIYRLRDVFRRAGGRSDTSSSSFNDTDTPGNLYFRLFFYFNNGRLLDTSTNIESDLREAHSSNVSGIKNTALNYLLLNNEFERSDYLETFIGLLSNINTFSPWYFQKITGLDNIVNKPSFSNGAFKIPDERPSITIECLPDAYDNRIGTMLDAYCAACYSERLHKEIIPANLRKFDMAIYLFNTPITNMMKEDTLFSHGAESRDVDARLGSTFRASSKLIELHNCEIDLTSRGSAYSELDNAESKQMSYQIKINFDVAREQRYSEQLMKYIGDLVLWDIDYSRDDYSRDVYSGDTGVNRSILTSELNDRMNTYSAQVVDDRDRLGSNLSGTSNIQQSRLSQVFGHILQDASNKVDRALESTLDKYDPIRNADRAVNGLLSAASSSIGNLVSNILLGNIFYDSKGLRGLVDHIDVEHTTRSNPSSSIETSLYKGWNKSS